MSRKDRPQPKPLADGAAERIGAIIEAAERAAAAIIDNADTHAQRYLEQAEAEADRAVAARLAGLLELTDSMVEQAEAIRRQSERLLATLERAEAPPKGKHLSAVPSEAPPEPAPEPPAEEPEPDRPEPPAAPERRPEEPEPRPTPPAKLSSPAGARLLATQMAVSGNSRKEIETRLRTGFDIEDTASILDAILGPEE